MLSLLFFHSENDPDLLTSVLVFLRIVQNIPSSGLLNAHYPALMESIWNGLFASKLLIRERTAELLRLFLGTCSHGGAANSASRLSTANLHVQHQHQHQSSSVTASPPPQTIIQQFRLRAKEQLQRDMSASLTSFSSAPVAQLHGTLLLISILGQVDRTICGRSEAVDFLLRLTAHRDSLLRTSAIRLIPRLLPYCQSLEHHKWFTFLLDCIKKERDRACALTALADTIKVCTGTTTCLDSDTVESVLAVLKPILQQMPSKLRKGDLADSIGALDCVACLAELLGDRFRRPLIIQILPLMLSCPLWSELITALARINCAIPETIRFAEDVLLTECTAILMAEPPAEVDRVLLAIKCLGTFKYSQGILNGPLPMKLMQVYLNDSRSPLVRAAAAETLFTKCRELKYEPGFKLTTTTTTTNTDSGSVSSGTGKTGGNQEPSPSGLAFCPFTKWIVRGIVAAVVTRMVADDHPLVAERILNEFLAADSECFSTILAHPDCIRPLFAFLSSNNALLQQRIKAAKVLSHVAALNQPALVPSFRKLLLQYLSEIECLPIDDDSVSSSVAVPDESSNNASNTNSTNSSSNISISLNAVHSIQYSSARLLQAVLEWPAASVAPYVPALLRALMPRLKNQPVQLIECFLSSLSRLVAVQPDEFIPHMERLLTILTQLIADLGSLRKRKAGLGAAVAVLRLIDRKVVPLELLVGLMNVSVDLLKTEMDPGVRREAVRLMGIIGAIDPYTLNGGEQAGTADHLLNGSLVVQLSRGEEFFAGVVVDSLLKILKDPTLAAHHLAATQALGYLVKTLGVKSHIFLPSVMPALLAVCYAGGGGSSGGGGGVGGSGGGGSNLGTCSITAAAVGAVSSINNAPPLSGVAAGAGSTVSASPAAIGASVSALETGQATQSAASPAQLEFYFNQLAGVIRVVGVFIRPFVDEIVSIIVTELCAILGAIESNEQLAVSGVSKTTALLHLTDVLAFALRGEFRPLLPRLLPPILQLLQPHESGFLNAFTLQKVLQTLAILGPQLSEYAGIVGDTLVLLLRGSVTGRELRIAVLRVCTSLCKDVTAIADNPAILQSLTMILRDEMAGPEVHGYCMDAVMSVTLAQGRDFFRFLPALKTLILQRQAPRHVSFFERLFAAKESLNSPAKMAELTAEYLKVLETQLTDLTQIDAGGAKPTQGRSGLLAGAPAPPPTALSMNTFARFADVSACASRDDWLEWLKRFGLEMLRASPSPSLRACCSLANVYHPLARELFNAAFAAVFPELPMEGQSAFIYSIQSALANPVIPSEVVQVLLNLAEFMERQERPLPIDVKVLGTHAARYHAFAKALYYKEQELLSSGREGKLELERGRC